MSGEYDENNEAFSIRRGATIFLITFLVSVIIGSIFSRMLSGPRLKAMIGKKLESAAPDIEFDLGYSKIQLSDGGWPMIGLSVDSLIARRADECGKRLHLRLEKLLIPFDFFYLLNGQIRIGDIEVRKLSVYEVPQVVQRCEVASKAQEQKTQALTKNTMTTPSFHVEEPKTPIPLDSVSVKEIIILNKNGDPSIALTDLHAKQTEGGLVFDTSILPTLSDISNVVPLRLKVEIFDHYDKAKLRLGWREGVAEGALESLKSRDVSGHLFISKMPLSEMYKLARRLALVVDDRDMGANWLDAKMHWSGAEQKVSVSNVVLSGDIGSVATDTFDINYGGHVAVTDFTAKLSPLKIDEVLRVLKVDEIQRLFVTAGEVNGEFKFNGKDMNLAGSLEKATALFSREGRRSSLKIKKANFSTGYQPGHYIQGRISGIEIENGKWNGGITWQHKFLDSSTEFDMEFAQLDVPTQVTQPLFAMTIGEMKGALSIVLDHGKVKDLRLQSEIEKAQGEHFSAGRARLRAIYQKGKAEGRFLLDRLSIDSDVEGFEALGNDSEKSINFQKFDGKLSYADDVLLVGPIDFSAPVSSGELMGAWNMGRFNGSLVLRKVGSEKKFSINGPLESLSLKPQ